MSDQFKVAIFRGIYTSALVGAMAFLATWSQTDDVKTLVIASLTPVVTNLAVRAGIEGAIDTAAAKRLGR